MSELTSIDLDQVSGGYVVEVLPCWWEPPIIICPPPPWLEVNLADY